MRAKMMLTVLMMILMTGHAAAQGVVVNGSVFGGGNEAEVQGDSKVNMETGTVSENVFGGGNLASVKGNVTVIMSGGTVTNDVYGGGALADTNTDNWNGDAYVDVTETVTVGVTPVAGLYEGSEHTLITNAALKAESGKTYYRKGDWASGKTSASNTTNVYLLGGTVIGDVYGGGLGEKNHVNGKKADNPAYVDGDVKVYLNGFESGDADAAARTQFASILEEQEAVYNYYHVKTGGCVVTGSIFGCNNLCGSPRGKVKVHVFKTAGDGQTHKKSEDKKGGSYELDEVYGGGNMAAYEPLAAESGNADTKASAYPEVIIDGCENTSISKVYGGGNAASTPATNVTVYGTYEIGELFGGGNGADKVTIDGDEKDNPGANVGFREYDAEWNKPYALPSTSKQERIDNYGYGSGKAKLNIYGGLIHSVYGGSNTKGNVREVAVAMLNQQGTCSIDVDEAYGGGKSAPMDGEALLDMRCVPRVGKVFGGARHADVNNNVTLNITNGTFNKVFGGNNEGGRIFGSITVNVEEIASACYPIIIGELYAGGNVAGYSVYGNYEKDSSGEWQPTEPGANDSPQYDSPQLNLRSFTSIGNVYGGGYQAMVIGDPEININEIKGKYADTEHAAGTLDEVPYPKHEANTIGAIGNVYGGGFGADVKGSPKVNIGTVSKVAYVAGEDHAEKDIVGASITGSVYGGGYGGNTNVTGTATVNIGEKRDVKDGEGNVTSTTYHPHNTSIGGDIYGGSALGAVANTQVNLYAGSLTSNVFGGGMGQTGTDAKSATISTMATVSLYEATVTGNIYGGCNANGTAAATTVNIKGGTVGTGTLTTTTNSETSEVSITAWNRTKASNVHGGGYGKDTYVTGSVLVNIGEENATSGPTIFGDVYGGGALGHVNGTKNTSTETGALPITSTANATTTVNLYSGTIYGDAYGGGLGDATNAAYVGGTVSVNQNGVAYIIDYYPDDESTTSDDESTIVKSGRIFGCNNLNGYPLGDVNVTINKTAAGNVKRTAADANNPSVPQTGTNVTPKYELAAVYGGGNLAPYNANNMKASVWINGCGIISIETVYGGGNAAAVPETDVLVDGCYEIGTVFGGGNGKDKYKIGDGAWTANPGANVGKTVAGESIGSGNAKTILQGGYIHEAYGGSNSKGTISGNITIKKQDGDKCDVTVDHIYGAGKDADVEGDLVLDLGCSTTRTEEVYGCAKNANVKGNVDVIITSGEYGKVFGGNNESGAIFGRIKVHIEETGCTPIIIDELYGCGNDAAYSVYGYYQDGTIEGTDKPKYVARTSLTDGTAVTFGLPSATDDHTKPPYADPEVNIVSCTRIGKVFGGGLGSNATVYGNPKVNINQIPGKYALAQLGDADKLGSIGVDKDGETTDCGVFGGGNKARVEGNTTVNIGNLEYVEMVSYPKTDVRGYYTRSEGESSYTYTEVTGDAAVPATPNTSYYKKVLGANILSNVFGGGNKADVTGNTFVNICAVLNPVLGTDSKPTGDYTYTSVDHSETTSFDVSIGESVYGGGSEADVKGNTRVTMTDGYVFDGVYGGGLQGSVGTFTRATLPSGHSAHTGCVNGKPDEWTTGTGKCTVVISGGQIGPVEVAMADGGMKNTGRYFEETGESGPVDVGFVFGAGRGAVENPYDDPDADFHTYVKETEVTISGTALIMASVYGGGENGRVRGNTKVKIEGGQIGCGVGQIENGKPKRYTDGQFIDPANPNTPVTETNALAGCATWDYGAGLPYDPLADKLYTDGTSVTDASTTGSDGHTYYGSVFGGGSGYYPYESTDGTKHDWLESAGLVEGDTEVEITGGHILTSVYGGNELTNVGGTCKVTMSGGTIGVPRTKTQIENNPSIGNLFGAGKGDKRVHFNTWTNVKETIVNVTGGIVYGSVFGGGEDGHVLEDATTLIEEDKTNNKTITIGSTGESGADGNVFGGGRGSETALTAGVVGGNVGLTIKSGNVLGSVYGGGRLAAVGTNFVNPESTSYGVLQSPDADHGNITVNINGGTIGTNASTGISGNIYGGSKGTTADFRLGIVRSTTINMTGGTAYASVYGGGELAQVVGSHTTDGKSLGTEINISGGTIGISGKGRATWGNVFAGGKGNTTHVQAGLVKTNTKVTISETDATNKPTTIYHNIYGGGAYGSVGTFDLSTDDNKATYGVPYAGMPVNWTSNTGKATINITGGTIGTNGNENGMVFGSSRGDVGAPDEIHDYLAWVYDTDVTIDGGQINGSIYGGGENGHTFKDAKVTIHDGIIGIASGSKITGSSGKEYEGAAYPYRGNVYGGGCGTDKYWADRTKETNKGDGDTYNPLAGIVYGNTTITMDGGTVVHNIYGAGAMGSVGQTTKDTDNHLVISDGGATTIAISGGTVGVSGTVDDGNVFGAARGDATTTQTDVALVKTTGVTISGTAKIKGNVYGGGALGDVGTYYTVTADGNDKGNNVYLGGSGACVVNVIGGTVGSAGNTTTGHVFGAGKGDATTYTCLKAMVNSATVTVSNGTIYGNVYGGGEVGRVENNTTVAIGEGDGVGTGETATSAPEIHGSVFGAGAGLETHGYSALVRGNSTVTVEGNAKVRENVYGGGEIATVGKYWVSHYSPDPDEAPPAGFPDGMPYKTRDGGFCTVTVQGHATVGPEAMADVSDGAGHVFGAGRGVVPHYDSTNTDETKRSRRMNDQGDWEYFTGDTGEAAYLQFLETLALASNTIVTVNGNAAVKGSVYGGSESGFVQDHTTVTVEKGTIGASGTYAYNNIGNVFGGGRGISGNPTAGRVGGGVTLTMNDGTTHGSVFGGGEMGVVKGAVVVSMNGGEVKKDVYGGGALANTNTGNTTNTTDNTTTVNLFGGLINGDAYGGGLGQLAATGVEAVEAKVYGDVNVTLDGTAFNISYVNTDEKDPDDDTKYIQVVNSGRVFGCNNLNGSPQGDVTVTVNKTVKGNVDRTRPETSRNSKASPESGSYELAAVYGGGNLANYVTTATGKKASVIINGCPDTSIETVYGGGNAAAVPETDVLIMGAYEIGTVFGGGNGKDKFTTDDGAHWTTNPGANVNGNVKTILKGGCIHEAYGGSNEKGTISGSAYINSETGGECTLDVGIIYAAGKNADIQGDLITILGCKDSRTEEVYGGAKNANVKGNVELTITSGEYGKVFGGNNQSGSIFGHIKVNIEETGCTPIKIDELYLGGNQAAYSTSGYWAEQTGTDEQGDPVYTYHAITPETPKDDAHKAVSFDFNDHTKAPYADPEMNIISCTYIGKVFGGGFGDGATLYGNPKVNINQIYGTPNGVTATALGEIGGGYTDKNNQHVEGGVFGGGNAAKVIGDATVNIGTATTVQLHESVTDAGDYTLSAEKAVLGANIVGNVYGGGNLADVTGNTFVNVCAVKSGDSYAAVTEGTAKVNIAGNVFGGGRGVADNFLCDKAMVGTNDAGLQASYSDGNTSVIIGNGTVNGNVYGGGQIGRVEMNTTVTVGLPGAVTSSPDIKGDIFGGGMGDKEHGYAGLVRGNPTVAIQANAKVKHNVYGGGEIASVARYKVPITDEELAAAHSAGYTDAVKGRPYALKDVNSGFCTVTVRGNAVIGPDDAMLMTKAGGPDDAGHVFGAGKGIMPGNYDYASETVEHKPRCRANDDSWAWFADIDEYIAFIQTLALSSQTTVNIGDANDSNSKPFIKGSVYGGSENGLVQFDTNVNIIGGQIGCGKNANGKPHPDGIWADDYVPDGTDYECASWDYGKEEGSGDNKKKIYAPYDPFANAEGDLDKYPAVGTQAAKSTEGGRRIATDGHTYYGNVFGGGSGSVPYFDTTEGISKYLNSAGTVKGNTNVIISGGHILTSVYGGCEATNVLGTANVTMTGGTVGVPRTDEQILAHPVTCNLFGAGKGDQRVFFNKDTNVENAVIQINGGRIYGSVFGGGEDGHVMKNVTLTIEEKNSKTVKIGSAGTSYMDGNVFGGGRGFGGDALTAGNVGGTVTLDIKSGSVLGSVYGGGRLASVGYGLYLTTEAGYGEMREDGKDDKGNDVDGFKRGYINVNISGGTIGNTVANAQYGGNVFGGSMGSIVKQDGTVNTQWDKFATAKKTTVNVTGGTIMRSVYGGGEMGTVTTDAIVNVSGGTIGTTGKGGAEFGNVYGGGKGYVDPDGTNYITAGIIKGNAEVAVSEADAGKPTTIYHNIYGGGAYGSVGDFDYDTTTGMPTGRKANTTGGKATVNITGGTIGTTGKENGMIFGSSRGDVGAPGSIHDKLAWVYDTEVTIGGGQINGSVYGGGENGHIFNDAVVSIAGGTVGIADGEPITDNNGTPDDDSDDITYTGAAYPYRGNVYGGGCGTDKYYTNTTGVADPHDGNGDSYNPLAGIVYGKAIVTMDGGQVVHNIYGAGAMGSVGKMEKNATTNAITFNSGGTTTIAISGGTVGVDGTVGYGNVFGAARGDETTDQTDVALVKTTKVTISQADGKTTNVWGSVYGGGETGDVGTYSTSADDTNTYSEGSGACVVAVTGGTVHHNVFGAGKGVANSFTCQKAMVKETSVTISNGTVKGNVYGGGELGRVEYDTEVKVGDGTDDGPFAPVIEGSVFGAGAGVETHGYSALVRNNSAVTVKGNAKVRKNVYGGGQIATVGRYWVTTQNPVEGQPEWPTGMPMGMPYANRSGGTCTVLVQGNATVGPETGAATETAGHVFGAGMGADPKDYTYADDDHKPKRMKNDSSWEYLADITAYHQFLETLALATETHVTIGGTDNEDVKVKGSVYGGSENGFVQHHTAVSIQKGCEIGTTNSYGNIYGGGKGTMVFDASGRVSGHTLVTINDGIAHGSVYGGGEMGVVKEDVTVNINGGTIDKDVYGGGALANTNIGNWDATNNTWASGKTSASSTTHVNLTGGTISGDAYGGGLGRLGTDAVAAMVYGDVFVTLGTLATAENSAATATAFNISNYTGDYADVVKSGRVFGCNNLNGSPKGNVTVTVNKTVKGNVGRTPEYNNTGRPPMGDNADPNRSYEVAAVYGGGNLADYVAEGTGKKTNVIINTCDVSIEEIYGGGNAAEVPETNVLVNGAYEIEHVFGGGNGKDQFTLDGGTSWNTNPGADIVGNTNTLIRGGYVHEAYGASNEKGTITGTVTIDTGTGGDCQVQVDKLVAAGKNADVNGDLIVILGCKDATKIPLVYGGADNANVNGNVELTITSGHFGQVFGGNNLGGAIRGHIILNIEETSDCEPIRIDKLYLGGNQAAYSRFGYYVKTVETEAGTGKGASGETAVLTNDDNKRLIFVPRASATDSHLPVNTYGKDDQDKWTWTTTAIDAFTPYDQPVLNLISCTEVGEVFGGGYGVGGDMYADPTVNINMIPGRHAATTLGGDDKLGVIGDVYGGGDAASIVGNTTVNIGTTKKVLVKSMTYTEATNTYTAGEATVEGANITGNVYGGGKLADVGIYDVANDKVEATGNTYVNIGAALDATDATKYVAVPEGSSKVIVTGNVFGGGKGSNDTFKCEKAMVTGGTNINIGNGTVKGTVYGGGEVGRVENDTKVTIGLEEGTSTPVVEGYIFGAGKGDNTHGYSALVRGDTHVTIQGDAKVGLNVYGGGEIASVGRYKVADEAYHAAYPDVEVGMPYSTNQGGVCTVTVQGNAEIGPDGMTMVTDTGWPTGRGHVFGAGKGALPYENVGTDGPKRMIPDGSWESYVGKDTEYLKYIETLALTTMTDVTIAGKAFVKGSVYGGSENGHVQKDTHVTIDGDCQIGNGDGVNRRYTTDEWASETLAECAHWPYKPPYTPYDVYDLDANGKPKAASDGHTFYGNVFGGGSGIFPYAKDPNYSEARKALGYSDGLWLRSAGMVYGNTVVDIKGGHILTSVYGGNECTDVKGTTNVNMSGGTIGVPRTVDDIKAHPVTCYLFGAGKGDQRINFNTWTNVEKAIVNITGGRIFGSVFGGGEDGHVLGDVEMTISGENTLIGTTGTSYVDGNIFGGGRGFSGEAQTAGTVGGNIGMTISGGKILGSVYGGGRLASVGTEFTAAESPNYGNFKEDVDGKTYGHITIDINGGTIGNEVGNAESGNVFGASMGRLTLLNGDINPIWPKMAEVKNTTVTVSGGTIKRTVFGGGELGTVRDNATVNITGGTIGRDVYGAGYGSDDYTTKTLITVKEPKEGVTNPSSASDYNDVSYVFTPMVFTGSVGQNTYVNVSGGYVKKSVYGGGEMASAGIIDCRVKKDNSATNPIYTDGTDKYVYISNHKHDNPDNDFVLSWPYHFENLPGYFGATHVNVTGGRIGLKGGETNPFEDLDNGDVVGGSKGIAGDFNDYVFCANVGSTDVTINYPNTADPSSYDSSGSDVECITGAVYGGAENGHVMGDTKVTLKKGLVGHSVYGGGSGKGKFSTKLLKIGAPANSTSESDYYTRDIYSITAGKVFGNTEVIMEDGYVVRNVYGGGNMGSVGKGNYAGGPDDYSTAGYGEKVSGGNNLWTNDNPYSQAFLSSGRSKVTILGGTVGYINPANPSESVYGGLPYGNVFGGCRGEAAPNISESPRYLYSPEFFVGYVNETDVTIGTVGQAGPKILGSVYGGGMDGHVRRDASVTINSGEIGSENGGLDNGNVYGAGSGIGKYEYDFNYDNDFDDIVEYNNGRATVATKEKDYSSSAGSVTRFTTVDIKGGTIHRNVYGGGSLSSVGAPKIGQDYDPYHPNDSKHSGEAGKLSLNKVSISGGQIGDDAGIAAGYGGEVNGGSRGESAFEESSLMSPSSFASSVWTDVTISGSADVKGSVFGGGEAGMVKHDTDVKMLGGIVGNDLYGGGDMADVGGNTTVSLTGGQITNAAYGGARGTADNAANVGGDVLVDLNNVAEGAKGCVVDKVFGANNVNGTPKGHVKVHVHATQNKNLKDVSTKSETKGVYDMTYVFGGGNASDYVPEDATQSTEVIIDGCGLTSIQEVYGGGYGAATPGTNVRINGTEIIDNVFGGGYGAGADNPGANVGYLTDKDHTPYGLYLDDDKTKIAIVNLMAGKVNAVYGGSNTKGDIRNGAATETVDLVAAEGACPKLEVGELYGGGKNAEMEGGAEIILRCMPDSWIGEVYAGAREAHVGNDVSLTITSGKFEHVYGGNKSSGEIDGYVEVNIEECPTCNTPLIIGELYGGGNEAAYNLDTEKYGKDYPSPRVNVRAFTSIGTIYGGGKGEGAKVTGNPTVSINVGMSDGGGYKYDGETKTIDGKDVELYPHTKGKIGVIGNVFGGGNAAEVEGNTNVLIGTESYVQINRIIGGETDLSNGEYYTRSGAGTENDPYVYTKATGIAKENTVYYTPVIGVDIKGNVYGGGNNAGVTGNTNVVIGKEKVTTP